MDTSASRIVSEMTSEELWEYACHWTSEQWQTLIGQLTPEQITSIISLASTDHDPQYWNQKIGAAIRGLKEKSQLQAAGKSLSVYQIIYILDCIIADKTALFDVLAPLLVGMPQNTFRGMLTKVNQTQLNLLKQEAITEPMQHHLTLLTHELMAELTAFHNTLEKQIQEIEGLHLENIGRSDISKIFRSIESFMISGMHMLHETNQALALSWQTTRMDLIEKLSRLKENCQRTLTESVGTRRSQMHESAGLWSLVEKKLEKAFEGSDSPVETLRDEEPALEALVKFSVWYVKDYWEVGLLPHIKEEKMLELKAETHSEQERLKHRESLFKEASKNLQLLGLESVADLKHKRIFSKKALIEFIEENQSKLIPLVKRIELLH